MYTRSVEQSREQSVSVQTLQQQIWEKDGELARARASQELVQDELARARASQELVQDELARARANHQQQVQEKEDDMERIRTNHETELREISHKIQEKSDETGKSADQP